MKKFITILSSILLIGTFSSFKYSTSEVHNLIKATLELDDIQDLLEKENKQIIIVTNQIIPNDFTLFYGAEAIKIVAHSKELSSDEKKSYFEIVNFDIKGDQAKIKLLYRDYKSTIKLEKKENSWKATSVFIRNKGHFQLSIED